MDKKTYLVTGGLVSLFENRHGLVLSDECRDRIEQIERNYALRLGDVLNCYVDKSGEFEWDVKFISCRDIEDSLREIVKGNRTKRPLISLDDVYGVDLPDGFYSVTRTMDPNNLQGGTVLGSRLGYPSLEEQARGIAEKFGREIDIMDIGTFSGETITGEIAQRFKKEGININGAYLVFAGKEGIKNLQEAGLNPMFKTSIDWVDWLEIRDCVGFDGRKVSGDYFRRGIANAFVKYTTNSESWASIPPCFGKQFESLYVNSFDQIKRCLEEDGCEVSLTPSKENPLVQELRILQGE